jgi:hypothetical protein
MMSDDPFGSDFGSFEDLLANLTPGHKSSNFGLIRYREGADPTNWASGGASIYVPSSYFFLAGASKWTGAATDHGAVEVTFPVPFVDLPLVIGNAINTTPLFQAVWVQCPPASGASFEWYWWSTDNLTMVTIAWLAVGPAGTK